MISGIVHFVSDLILSPLEVGCVLTIVLDVDLCACNAKKVWTCLGCYHKLVSDASLLGPLAYDFL